jgi:hypothetical protein
LFSLPYILCGEFDLKLLYYGSTTADFLTHDRATMPDFAYDCLFKGQQMSGLFVINDRMPIRQAIDELLLLIACSEQDEWKGTVLYLPL